METCPFCKSGIPEDLLRFGGNCPHCFHHVPGEEEPTDPGVRTTPPEAQPSAERRWGLLAGLAVVALVGVAAWIVVSLPRQGTERARVTVEEDDFYMVPIEQIAETSMVPTGSGHPEPTGRSSRSAVARTSPPTRPTAAATGSPGSASARPAGMGARTAASLAPPPLPDPDRGPGIVDVSSASSSAGRIVPVRRATRDTVLRDPDQVASMVRGVLASYRGQLEHCYTQRLKQVPRLRGAWRITFTIDTDGRTREVAVHREQGSGDPEFEGCVVRRVESWRFRAIAVPQRFEKVYRFSP